MVQDSFHESNDAKPHSGPNCLEQEPSNELVGEDILDANKKMCPVQEVIMVSELTAQNMNRLNELEMNFDGPQVLRNIFDTMALNGRITMDQLPFVLAGSEVQATAEEIDQAIEENIPDAEDADTYLDFDQVLCLYNQLVHGSADMAQLEPVIVVGAEETPGIWKRMVERFHSWKHQSKARQTAYEKHMKPTTRLLLVILFTSSLLCFAVVLFGLLFIWNHSNQVVANHVKRDAQLIADGLQHFGYAHPMENYAKTRQRIAMLLGMVVDKLGYENTKETLKSNLMYQQLLLTRFLDGWFVHDSKEMVAASVFLVKGWLERMLNATDDEAVIIKIVDAINQRLPIGHETVLSRWNSTAQKIQFLTQFRFRNQCLNGTCGSDPNGAAPTKAALAGKTGTLIGNDYRPKKVIASHTWLEQYKIGLVYKVDLSVFQDDFLEPAAVLVDDINRKATTVNTTISNSSHEESQEIVLGAATNGTVRVISMVHNCGANCLQSADVNHSTLASAIRNITGVNETNDFGGVPVYVAYGPLQQSGLGLAVKINRDEVVNGLYRGLGNAFDMVNRLMDGTNEVQLVSALKPLPNATNADFALQFHTLFSFSEECEGICGKQPNTSVFLQRAVQNCESGVMEGLDYRGELVTAGYACIESLQAGLAIKVDHHQIIQEGLGMVSTIATFQNEKRYAGKSTEVMVGQKKPGVATVTSARDYNRVTVLKLRDQCPNLTCTGRSSHMTRALQQPPGIVTVGYGPDYRNKDCVGGAAHIENLEVGLVVKIDIAEALRGSVYLTLELTACSLGAIILTMGLLALLSNVLLKSMDRAWDEGKKAVEREKQQFRKLITSMYPAQVAKRMLAGEPQVVYNVPIATVFFSDIYEFTSMSNVVSPQELIQFMGYTFGCMDHIAEYYHVYKIKTIGDAYLAVTGLPGMESLNGNGTLDMLLFSSCCAQIFSARYLHPDDGAILDKMVIHTLGKKKAVAGTNIQGAPPSRPAHIAYGTVVAQDEGAEPQVHCIMRYGVAAGAITAGVLQGKTPLFDVWGKPVNLASRMESTGQPGRIQVSEAVYSAVVSLKGQPFTFTPRHKVVCKGFGNVNAYYVDTCSVSVPKDLLNSMGIEVNFGQFYFDNPVPGFKAKAKGAYSGSHGSGPASSADQMSAHSSGDFGNHIRANATLG